MAQKIRLEDRECPLSATLGLVGEWWTLLILHDAFDGYSRFDQFQENLGISSSLLTSRLKRMVGAGLLERRQYQANPARYEYLLTELGRSLRPVHRRPGRMGQRPPRPPVSAAWCWWTPRPGPRPNRSSSTAQPGGEWTGPDFVFTAGPAASRPFQDRYAAHPKPPRPK